MQNWSIYENYVILVGFKSAYSDHLILNAMPTSRLKARPLSAKITQPLGFTVLNFIQLFERSE